METCERSFRGSRARSLLVRCWWLSASQTGLALRGGRARAREGLWDAAGAQGAGEIARQLLPRRRDRSASHMRAVGSAAARPAGAKAAQKQMSDDDLHAEYAWAFVLHNLVPFADKLLGIAGRALRRNQLQRCTPSTRCWPHDCVCSIV